MEVTCRNCGYRWDYQGDNPYYTECTHCRKVVRIAEPPTGGGTGKKGGGRSMEPLTPPDGVELGSFEGQRWILLTVQGILLKRESLTPGDIKILNDLRDSVKALKELDAAKAILDLDKRLKALEGARR